MSDDLSHLLLEISSCVVCQEHLPLGCNPVLTAGLRSKIIVIGQAPGHIVHATGIPWNDKSGDRLRIWMGIDKEMFYNIEKVSLIPMGFCYPGSGDRGDLPPRPECAPLWHHQLIDRLPQVQLIILAGMYAQKYYLAKRRKKNLTLTVQHYAEYLPRFLPIPHPSGRNNIWLKKNPWFEEELVPHMQYLVKEILDT